MNQDGIWDFYQNEGIECFSGGRGRFEYLVRRLQPRIRVLNVGVGNGILEEMALSKGAEIWSLDPSEAAIDRLRQRLGLKENAQVGHSQKMPFQNAHFDIVIMSEVLEHLDDETLKASLSEVYRVLKEGGEFMGTVPARERLFDSLVVCPRCSHRFHRWGHQQCFDVEGLSALFTEAFKIKEIHEIFFIEWDSVGWWRRLQGLVKKFLSWRGVGTYGISRNIFFLASKRG